MMALSVTVPQQSPPLYPPSSNMPTMALPGTTQNQTQQQAYSIPQNMPPLHRTNTAPQMSPFNNNAMTPSAASANMWADSVARTLDSGGMKRRWDGNMALGGDQSQAAKRPR